MSTQEPTISAICSAISSVCLVIAVLIIGIPKLINNGQKRKTLDLKIKHLMNLIDTESRPPSTVPPTHIVIDMKDVQNGRKRYSFANIQQDSLSPSEVVATAKTD